MAWRDFSDLPSSISWEGIAIENIGKPDWKNHWASGSSQEEWDQVVLHWTATNDADNLNFIKRHWEKPSIITKSNYFKDGNYLDRNVRNTDATAGENGLSKYYNLLVSNPPSRNDYWNKSVAAAISQVLKLTDEGTTFLKDNVSIKNIRNADAANAFGPTSSSIVDWVEPWLNISGNSYSVVRDSDKILSVLNNKNNLQFTRSWELKGSSGYAVDTNDWIRLIMPKYTRRVEVEDLNRNFWVIAQVLGAVCETLYSEDSPLTKALNGAMDEITQLWDNTLYLWTAIGLVAANAADHTYIKSLSRKSVIDSSKASNAIEIAKVYQQGEIVSIYAPVYDNTLKYYDLNKYNSNIPDKSSFSHYDSTGKKTPSTKWNAFGGNDNPCNLEYLNTSDSNKSAYHLGKIYSNGEEIGDIRIPKFHPYGAARADVTHSSLSHNDLIFGPKMFTGIWDIEKEFAYGIYYYNSKISGRLFESNTYKEPMITKGDNFWIGGIKTAGDGSLTETKNMENWTVPGSDGQYYSDKIDHFFGNLMFSTGWYDPDHEHTFKKNGTAKAYGNTTVSIIVPQSIDHAGTNNHSMIYKALHDGNIFIQPIRYHSGLLSHGLQVSAQEQYGAINEIVDNNDINDISDNGNEFTNIGNENYPLVLAKIKHDGKTHWYIRLNTSGSSKNIKENINYNVDKNKYHSNLMKLSPCTFDYIEGKGTKNHLGLIVEDIEQIDPYLCKYDETHKAWNFEDRDIMTMLIVEAQQKDEEIQSLKSEVEELKTLVNKLLNKE